MYGLTRNVFETFSVCCAFKMAGHCSRESLESLQKHRKSEKVFYNWVVISTGATIAMLPREFIVRSI